MSWQSTCYFVEGIVSIPLYLRILFLLWQFRKKFITYKSPYYTLILSQGVMDILSWFLFAILIVGRQIRPIGEVLFAVDHYKVAWMINSQATFLLISRAVGVALISIQRYLVICNPSSKAASIFIDRPPWQWTFLHFFVPIIISLPIISDFEVTFDSPEMLNFMKSSAALEKSSLIHSICDVVCIILILISYGGILVFIIENSNKNHRKDWLASREIRICLQIIPLILAFGAISAYFVSECILNRFGEHNIILVHLRPYYQVFSATFSFIHPWTILCCNSDIRKRIFKSVKTPEISAVRRISNTNVEIGS